MPHTPSSAFESLVDDNERGSGMIEILMSLCFLAVIGLSIMWSAISGARLQKQVEVGNAAMNLAVSKAESLAGIATSSLDDTFDSTESDVESPGHNLLFTRETDVTVNADGSRTVLITVTGDEKFLPIPISYSTTFAPWES